MTVQSLLAQIALPSEHGSAVQRGGCCAFSCNERFQRWSFARSLEPARLIVEALQRLHLLSRPSLAFCTADFSTRMVSS